MIVRILGEGQFEIAGEHAGELGLLDAQLQSADEAGDEAAFTATLHALRDTVRRHGAPVPLDALVASELVLPAEDTSLDQVRALLAGEGLIPG
jgi:hypothetical protein